MEYYKPDGLSAVVPGPFDPALDDFSLLQDYTELCDPFVPALPMHKPAYRPPAHAAVPVKPEPQGYFDYDPRHAAYWTPSGGMDMTQYPPTSQPPLPLSQPPTPGAECMVSSTISPLASPFSPRSEDGSFDDLNAPYDMTQPIDLGDVNIKGLTEEQLVSLTARDLNRLCRDLPDDVIKQLKKRRRTLKNRGYAYNSRVRRVSQKNTLEKERDELKTQVSALADKCRLLQEERNQWKRRAQALERGEEVWSPDK